MADGRQRKQADGLRKGYTDMQTHRGEKPAFLGSNVFSRQTEEASRQTGRGLQTDIGGRQPDRSTAGVQ
jgi:hypothetical protein